MQVSLNGKAIAGLDRGLERRLAIPKPRGAVEGVVYSADQAVAAAGRGMKWLYGSLAVLAAIVMLFILIAAAVYEPRDLVVIVPFVVVLAAALAGLMVFVYRRNLGKVRRRADAHLPSAGAPGAAIRLDDSGLTFGAELYPWAGLTIAAMDVTQTTMNDATVAYVEWLALSGGRAIVLDILLVSNGRAVVNEAWRRLRPAPAV